MWNDADELSSYCIVDNHYGGGFGEPHLKATSGINTLSGLLSADWYYWDDSGLSKADVTIEKIIPTELSSSIITVNKYENTLFKLVPSSVTTNLITRIWKTIPTDEGQSAIKGIYENNVYYWFYLANSNWYEDLFNENSLSAFLGDEAFNDPVFISSTTYIDPYGPIANNQDSSAGPHTCWNKSEDGVEKNTQYIYFGDRLQVNFEWSRKKMEFNNFR